MHAARHGTIAALLFSAAACAGVDSATTGPNAPSLEVAASKYRTSTVATVQVSPSTTTVAVGSSVTLGVKLLSSSGTEISHQGVQITWQSSDTTVAKVSGSGAVSGLKNGVVKVTATVGTASGYSTVTVGTGTSTTTSSSSSSSSSTGTSSTGTVTSSFQGPGLSGMAFFYDDYTSYTDTKALLSNVNSAIGGTGSSTAMYNDGANAGLLQIDNTVLYNGHHTLKYNQPGGISSTPELWPSFKNGKTLQAMWLRVKLRFSPGYTTYGSTLNSSYAYKILGWGWQGINGRGSFEYTNTNQYTFEVNTVVNGVQTSYAELANRHVTTEWTDGGWYDYILYYQQTSPTTAVSKWWFAPDGQTPVLQATLNNTVSSGSLPPIDRVMLGLNFNCQRLATQNQAIWYGQWEVIDGTQYPDPFGLF